jgi:hypothetical protein
LGNKGRKKADKVELIGLEIHIWWILDFLGGKLLFYPEVAVVA